MSLSSNAQKALNNALANKELGEEVAAAIDAQGSGPADEVDAIGSTADMSALVPSAASISASNLTAVSAPDPTKAEVDAGIDALKNKVITALDLKADNADVETMRGEAEDRLDVIEAKIDEVIAALKAANLMSS